MLNPHATDPLQGAILRLGRAKIPILRGTVTRLGELMEREDEVLARDLAAAILCDPLLTLHVLRHLQTRRPNRRITEITTIEHAIMMLGVSTFFRQFRESFVETPIVEDILAGNPEALAGFFEVASRARHAAIHARRWAIQRSDIESDEVEVAAMLHDLAELLLWIFDPAAALAIARRMRADATLRSAAVQRDVLGYKVSELQLALCREWQLPDLLCSLMDEHQAHRPRARNVLLAVALARHSAHGWSNAALPDDIDGIRDLLELGDAETRALIYRTSLLAVAECTDPTASPSWLPPPADFMPGTLVEAAEPGGEQNPPVVEQVLHSLGSRRTTGFDLPVAVRDPAMLQRLRRLDAIAIALHGIRTGLGFGSVVWLGPDSANSAIHPQFVVGRWPMDRESGGCPPPAMLPLIYGDGEMDKAMICAAGRSPSVADDNDIQLALRAIVEAVETCLRP